MSYNAKEVGRRIRECRLKSRVTLVQAAQDLMLNEDYLRHIERGDRTPALPVFYDIAAYFEVSADYLLKGDRHYESLRQEVSRMISELQTFSKKL